jgi:hypothetical protein
MVFFAWRPLRVTEVQGGLAAYSMGSPVLDTPNISRDDLINSRKIRHRCNPLVDYIPLPRSDDGYLRISHTSVHEFLLHELREPGTNVVKNLISPDVLAQSCLNYLSQKRYSSLLVKLSPERFVTASQQEPRDVHQHHFLTYAAKYWYRHLEEVGRYSPLRSCKIAVRFLRSPQFTTMIQVQSLFIPGHFIQSFEPEDGVFRSMKKNLPDWLSEECGDYMDQYLLFIAEWGNFLQYGVTSHLNGELDRCFWGTLGEHHFLYRTHKVERYPSFSLVENESHVPLRKVCVLYKVNSKGTKLSLWILISK